MPFPLNRPGDRVVQSPRRRAPKPALLVPGAPPYPKQVQSVFDTRPIGSIDFHLSNVVAGQSDGGSSLIVSRTFEAGYVYLVRRVDVDFEPLLSISAGTGVDTTTVQILARRDGINVPLWEPAFGGDLSQVEIPTHIVVRPGGTLSILVNGAPAVSRNTVMRVTFNGTAVLTSGLPDIVEQGSRPVKVEEVEPLRVIVEGGQP